MKSMKSNAETWQLRLYRSSLMKKKKVSLVTSRLNLREKRVLDLGCAQGVVSYFIQQKGGEFIHADMDYSNLQNARKILPAPVFQMAENALPLPDESMDTVIALDILEHVDEDRRLSGEIHRVLKPGGEVVVATPIRGRFFLLNKIKNRVGLTPDVYGHKREGYHLRELKDLLSSTGFEVQYARTYAKFFTELFELMLNIFYIRKNRIRKSSLRSGAISPSSEKDMEKHQGLFRFYSRYVYPLLFAISKLDALLFFKRGYATFVTARKPLKKNDS